MTTKNAELSARNIADIKTAKTNTINVYDILKIQHSNHNKKAVVAKNRGGVRIMANVQYYDVILKPVVTEKEYGTYGRKEIHFLGTPRSNKISD
mgnify:CR=1 FL=1